MRSSFFEEHLQKAASFLKYKFHNYFRRHYLYNWTRMSHGVSYMGGLVEGDNFGKMAKNCMKITISIFGSKQWGTSGFNLTTCDSNFTILVEVFTNRILAENTYFTKHVEWTEQKITALKPANLQVPNYLAMSQLQKHSYWLFPTSFISLLGKSFVNIIFYGAKNNKLKRRDN